MFRYTKEMYSFLLPLSFHIKIIQGFYFPGKSWLRLFRAQIFIYQLQWITQQDILCSRGSSLQRPILCRPHLLDKYRETGSV